MIESVCTRAAPFVKLRQIGPLGLLAVVMLFAPLGQGVGLSAQQGVVLMQASRNAANELAIREVERLIGQN